MTALPKLTDRLTLGATGLAVSPVCLGWVEDPDVVATAFDAGINFFFLTVDMHWPGYEGSRRGLATLLRRRKRARAQIVVAAVSYVTQPEFTYVPFLELLDEVPELGHLDMLVIGGAYGAEFPTRLALYRDHLRRGEIGARALGTTFHDRAASIDAINSALIDVAFVRCNPAHPSAHTDLFPKLGASPTRVFNFNSMVGYVKPRDFARLGLAPEHWRPKPTDYYRFALSPPAVDGILCSLHTSSQVRALERALASAPLDEQEQRYLIDLATLAAGGMKLDEAATAAELARHRIGR
jgi:hypothetical protein